MGPDSPGAGNDQAGRSYGKAEAIFVILGTVSAICLAIFTTTAILLHIYELMPSDAALATSLSGSIFLVMIARAILSRALHGPTVYGRSVSARRADGRKRL